MHTPLPARDLRIDMFRGLALVMIFINHVPDNVLSRYTSRNFGFSDAAEAFVLLSGISAGLAYALVRGSGSPVRPFTAPWKRAFTLWWVQALIVLSIALMMRLTLDLPGIGAMADIRNVRPVLEDPAAMLVPLLMLAHQFNCADILPLYILFLLATPALVWIGTGWPRTLLFLSAALWLAAGIWSVNLRTWQGDQGWFFNPFSWQLLFVIGLLTGLAKARGRQPRRVNPLLFLLSVAVVAYAAMSLQLPWLVPPVDPWLAGLHEQAGLPAFAGSFDKTFLAPIRLLHILALAYVLACIPLLKRLAETRGAKGLVILGRNALPAFAAGSILAYGVQIVREVTLPPTLVDVVLIGVGLNLMLLVALLFDRRKRPA